MIFFFFFWREANACRVQAGPAGRGSLGLSWGVLWSASSKQTITRWLTAAGSLWQALEQAGGSSCDRVTSSRGLECGMKHPWFALWPLSLHPFPYSCGKCTDTCKALSHPLPFLSLTHACVPWVLPESSGLPCLSWLWGNQLGVKLGPTHAEKLWTFLPALFASSTSSLPGGSCVCSTTA